MHERSLSGRATRKIVRASALLADNCGCALLGLTLGCTSLESANDLFGIDSGSTPTLVEFNRGSNFDSSSFEQSPIEGCAPVAERPTLSVGQPGEPLELDEDTTWSCEANYVISAPLLIRPGVSLEIRPDTRIFCDSGVFLLVQRGGRLMAEGTRPAPIVFTSALPLGQRAPGDWRGLIMAGSGPSHSTNATLPNTLNDARAFFGGGANGDKEHDCGRLQFVRIEFAGGNTDEEATPSAALSLAACGTATQVDHVQIHRATDGLGLLGGTVGVTHAIVSNNALGDAIEWTGGYAGTMQYIVAQSAGAAAGLKGNNSDSDPSSSPVSRPVIFNATVVGIRPPLPSNGHIGFLLQTGSAGTLKNSIITNFDDAGIDLRSAQTHAAVSKADVSHILVHANGPSGTTHLTAAAAALDSDSLRDREPGLSGAAEREQPDFKPTEPSVMTDIAPTPPGFDPAATYRGALPFQGDDWTLEWTAYPPD